MRENFTNIAVFLFLCVFLTACSAGHYRQSADKSAYSIISQKQQEALGRTEPFSIESPEDQLRRRLLLNQNLAHSGPASLGSRDIQPIKHWPEESKKTSFQSEQDEETETASLVNGLTISLVEALQISARNSREYQTQKEEVFRKALDLDFTRDQFKTTLAGQIDGAYTEDRSNSASVGGVQEGFENSSLGKISRTFLNGITFTAQLGLDLVQMLHPSRAFSSSVFGDTSISIPLLRGAGRHIAAEPLTQAEREVLYAIRDFEQFKKDFSVAIADKYFSALQTGDQLRNQEENYRGLIASSRRAGRLAEAGKTPQIQVDQSVQNELRARDRWIAARQSYFRVLDQFKVELGLPPDANIGLDRQEFSNLESLINERLAYLFVPEESAEIPSADAPVDLILPSVGERGIFELDEPEAIGIALSQRVDLLSQMDRVEDAQRKIRVAADALRPELSLFGSVSVGERRSLSTASSDSSNQLDLAKGTYQGLLTLDLPLERTAEANAYRDSYIVLERAVRDTQALEDQIKLQVRNNLRDLEQARASLKIQYQAVKLAERRVRGAALNLEAGRAAIRDLLEAQESLLTTQNGLTAAMIDYRLAELHLQSELGILQVDSTGLWHETFPGKKDHDTKR